MSKLVVANNVTLDGVMQAPDPGGDDGFAHAGWAQRYEDDVKHREMGVGMDKSGNEGGGILLGRRTYERFASVWPHMPKDNPYTEVINNRKKWVASRTLKDPLEWNNSEVLKGDAADAVAQLKAQNDGDIVLLGSGNLLQSLMKRDLIDEYVLSIHPIVLGEGQRMFADGAALAEFELTRSVPTTTGVIIATYERAR
jgi:dihydrofolate reductase